jgi:hypothetical protein
MTKIGPGLYPSHKQTAASRKVALVGLAFLIFDRFNQHLLYRFPRPTRVRIGPRPPDLAQIIFFDPVRWRHEVVPD